MLFCHNVFYHVPSQSVRHIMIIDEYNKKQRNGLHYLVPFHISIHLEIDYAVNLLSTVQRDENKLKSADC